MFRYEKGRPKEKRGDGSTTVQFRLNDRVVRLSECDVLQLGWVDAGVLVAVLVLRELLRPLGGVWAAPIVVYALGAVALVGLLWWHRRQDTE